MKKLYLFAALAAMLAACSENDLTAEKQVVQQNAEEGAVTFDAYTQRATTRAGSVEIMKDESLRKCGFGVFGFYTNNSDYDPQSIPNFFYNQKIEWDGANWTYSPVKYWPNEYGDNAESDDFDRVSYFAYAPYVQSVVSTGKLEKDKDNPDGDKWGITGMTRNSAMGDPLIKYIASFDQSKAVDLIWGVCDDPLWSIVQDGSKQKINDAEMGLPWLNVYRPMETDNQRVKFTFKHALSQLSVNVDAFVDGYNNSKMFNSDQTRIFIRSISFTGFAMKGALNLNNTEKNKAYWLDYNGTADLETGEVVTIYDGRKDGKEGATGSVATNEKMLGLNPQFVQDVEWYSPSKVVNTEMAKGVTNEPATLFRKFNGTEYEAADQPALVIPTGEQMEVEIVYDIETVDNNLSTYVSDGNTQGSSIENRIKKSINFGENGLENGKHYTVNLHLGLNSVKFDAVVSDWVEAAVSPEADLPSNMPSFNVAATKADEVDVDWDYATTVGKEYIYAVSGFDGGEAVTVTSTTSTGFETVTVNSKPTFNGTENQANATGIAYVKAQIKTANNDVLNKDLTEDITVEGGVSGRTHTLDITQLARPLSMRVKEVAADGKSITLQRWDPTAGTSGEEISLDNAANWQKKSTGSDSDDFKFTILKNGVEMAKDEAATPAAGKYALGTAYATTQAITLGTAAVAGDIYTITVKTGDVAEETVVAKIGGISYAASIVNKAKDDADFINPLTIYGSGSVTYTSGTPSIATINATGKVDVLTCGTSTITATFTPENGTFVLSSSSSVEATYNVNVGDAVFGKSYTMELSGNYGEETLKIAGTFDSSSNKVTKKEGNIINDGPNVTVSGNLATITFTKYSNGETGAKERTQEIELETGTGATARKMTIILKQAVKEP